MDLCFATNNPNKVKEVWPLVRPDFSILSLAAIGCHEELPETQNTLEGNALQKAMYVYKTYNIPCFADDTGLEVNVLNGAPGVYSARYAGPQRNNEDNMRLLLANLKDQPDRRARFRTVIALVGVEKEPVFFEGEVKGTIIHERKGDQGFGYDPVFLPDGYDRTFAEMDVREKNTLSHRALAVKKLVDYLHKYKSD